MAHEQVFPVKLYNSARKEIEGVSTLCFPSMLPLDERAVLSTSASIQQGSAARAESVSNQKYRSWNLIIGKLVHQKGVHCYKYEVEIKKYIETPTSKTMIKSPITKPRNRK